MGGWVCGVCGCERVVCVLGGPVQGYQSTVHRNSATVRNFSHTSGGRQRVAVRRSCLLLTLHSSLYTPHYAALLHLAHSSLLLISLLLTTSHLSPPHAPLLLQRFPSLLSLSAFCFGALIFGGGVVQVACRAADALSSLPTSVTVAGRDYPLASSRDYPLASSRDYPLPPSSSNA